MKPANIILFPKWQKVLEEESIAAIKERRFEEALDKLNDLLSYQVNNHEIYTGKLICLMELERFDEAQELCESLIELKDEHYYQYIHIYLTLLFQTNQYDELIHIVRDELKGGKVPEHLKETFHELRSMSEKMRLNINHERTSFYTEALYDAVHQDNHIEQWRLIQRLSGMNIKPPEKVISLLVNEHVHPLVKSAIFLWAKEYGYDKPVEIHKFGIQLINIPEKTPEVKASDIAIEVFRKIQEIEQSNPSLYELMTTLFEHYLYVLYPIMPSLEDVPSITEAIHMIGQDYLNMKTPETDDDKVKKYIQEIKTTDILYASIIDD